MTPTPEKTKRTFCLDAEIFKKLDKLSASNERSRSFMVNKILKEYFFKENANV